MNRIRATIAVLLLAAAAGGAGAQSLIVDLPAVERAIAAGALVWDTRSAEEYAKGHINVGALNGRLSSLQARVNELEAELAKLKAPAARP